MLSYTRTPTPRKPQTLAAWQQREYTQALREDHQRPAGAASLATIAYYAHLDEVIEGYAVYTPATDQVFFLDGHTVTEIPPADVARRVLLHGRVELADAQWQRDLRAGDLATLCTSRTP